MSNSIFRIFNPGAPKEDPVQKRRGQLRRAQQTYRDRKDKYTKALEHELAETRSSEARLARECEKLRIIVQSVSNLLSRHGIEVPPEARELSMPGLNGPDHPFQAVESLPSSPQLFSPESLEDFYLPRAREPSAPLTTSSNSLSASNYGQAGARVCDLDQVTMGMEFVLKLVAPLDPSTTGPFRAAGGCLINFEMRSCRLTLYRRIEEPCLGHLHGDPQKPNEPGGHALTTSSQLLSISNHQPSAGFRAPHTTCPSYQNAPTTILERLLSLAPDLSSDGEMTPIQAWNSLRLKPQFGGLNSQSFWALAEGLRNAVKCHGFGAVVQKHVFEDLVHEKLVLGQSF